MANALKDGLVGYYPLQSNAVNMVDGVAGTINGTASWVKNQAGKVVLDDTTASVTHSSHAINTVTYWKDGKFYAVLNGVPYMIDEALSSSFTSCATSTTIGCWLPFIEFDFLDANLYTSGADTLLRNTGTGGSVYDVKAINTISEGSIIAEDMTYGSTTKRGWIGNDSNRAWQTLSTVPNLGASPFVFECLLKVTANATNANWGAVFAQRNSLGDLTQTVVIHSNYLDGSTQTSTLTVRYASGKDSIIILTRPSNGTVYYMAAGLGNDRKSFININGTSVIAGTAVSQFLSLAKTLTLGGYGDLSTSPANTMFNGTAGMKRIWNGINKTAAQLAALSEAREDKVYAGTATREWPELYA